MPFDLPNLVRAFKVDNNIFVYSFDKARSQTKFLCFIQSWMDHVLPAKKLKLTKLSSAIRIDELQRFCLYCRCMPHGYYKEAYHFQNHENSCYKASLNRQFDDLHHYHALSTNTTTLINNMFSQTLLIISSVWTIPVFRLAYNKQ
jgi:hypothetical protein